jgi:predicted O-methyltransferase YrrM
MSPSRILHKLSLIRFFSRIGRSIGKRLFWRSHLQQAIQNIEIIKKELPTMEMKMAGAMTFHGKGFYHSLILKQNLGELGQLISLLEQEEINNVCEIGTFRGGTLFLWCQLAGEHAHITSIDLPGGSFGGGYNARSLPFFQSFTKKGQTLECLRGSSHDPEIRQNFKGIIGPKLLDFLFIDGDHTYEGIKKDYEHYAQYVRKGGVIAFHDILQRENEPDIGVWKLWKELKASHDCLEFIGQESGFRKIGIGVIRKI